MTDRKSLKIRLSTAERFERFQRDGETQTEALARLLDVVGVPEFRRCEECGDAVQGHARDDNGKIMCFDCAGIDPSEHPFLCSEPHDAPGPRDDS